MIHYRKSGNPKGFGISFICKSLTLYKGQVGTIVMEFDGTAFEVEFANNNGTTYAMETIATEKLMLLHYELVAV